MNRNRNSNSNSNNNSNRNNAEDEKNLERAREIKQKIKGIVANPKPSTTNTNTNTTSTTTSIHLDPIVSIIVNNYNNNNDNNYHNNNNHFNTEAEKKEEESSKTGNITSNSTNIAPSTSISTSSIIDHISGVPYLLYHKNLQSKEQSEIERYGKLLPISSIKSKLKKRKIQKFDSKGNRIAFLDDDHDINNKSYYSSLFPLEAASSYHNLTDKNITRPTNTNQNFTTNKESNNSINPTNNNNSNDKANNNNLNFESISIGLRHPVDKEITSLPISLDLVEEKIESISSRNSSSSSFSSLLHYDNIYAKNIIKSQNYKDSNTDEQFDAMDDSLELYKKKQKTKKFANAPTSTSTTTTGMSNTSAAEERIELLNRERRDSVAYDRIVENCCYCYHSPSFLKSLLISNGVYLYISIPRYGYITPGHILISSKDHTAASIQFDEMYIQELNYFKKHLEKMYAKSFETPKYPIFIETVTNFKSKQHCSIHSLPLSIQEYEEATLYFHKELNEVEEEWSQHKKIIKIPKRSTSTTKTTTITTNLKTAATENFYSFSGLHRVLPRGFPYFSVEFGLNDGGYVHVIEEESEWQEEFGLEIIRGLLGQESKGGRKGGGGRASEKIEKERVETFKEKWKKFDWTAKLIANNKKGIEK